MTRAEFTENLRVALDTLRAHKVRSSLTLLGIVIGVTSVIGVAAIINGLNRYISDRIERLGSRSYFVGRMGFGIDPGRPPERIRRRKYLEYDYAERVKEMAPAVEKITAMGTRAFFFGGSNEARYGGQRVENVILRGANADYCDIIPLFTIETGRMFTPAEDARSAHVAVIGAGIANSLFGRADPLGKLILVNGAQYEVIGVFAPDEGFLGGPGVDQFILVPLNTFRKHNPDMKEVFLAFTVRRDVPVEAAVDQVTEALRRIRKVPHNAENDFELFSSDFLTNLWNQLTGAIVILTTVISSIGLLIGGVGVMNIMLISVTERTREIGIRRAVGARAADIRAQFLLEAVTLTMIGGLIGLAAGYGIAVAVRSMVASIPAYVSVFWTVMGVALSAMTGLVFGYWPADRAARLDPVVCLRYE
ncbi:MAG: ABC transporter permease, partial [Bryobacteraceae bacterium]|nr:ABC transporter permease [Bryobacteraceae bacterium]